MRVTSRSSVRRGIDRRTESEQRIVRTLDTKRNVGWIEHHLLDDVLIFVLGYGRKLGRLRIALLDEHPSAAQREREP